MKTGRRRLFALAAAIIMASAACVVFLACNGRKDNGPGLVVKPADDDLPRVPDGPPFFEDATAKSGVDFTYRNGEEANHMGILESLGGGAALIDFDGDGLLDLFIPGGGHFSITDAEYEPRRQQYETEKKKLLDEGKFAEATRLRPKDPPKIHGYPGRLYHNKGNFQFEDVTAQVGLDKQPDVYTHGAAVCDYDGDGWPDLLVTGYGRVILYHNEPGANKTRRFVDVTEKAGLLAPDPRKLSEEAGLPGEHFWSTSAAWGDLDGDGHPDLYLCQYVNWSFVKKHPPCPGYSSKYARDVCPPKDFDSRPHALWRNNGDGTFTNVAKSAGLRVVAPVKNSLLSGDQKQEDGTYLGKGLGVLFIDVDGDGKPDIYVCNDTTDNFLYLNRSTPGNLEFEDKGSELGVSRDNNATANGSMGVDAADFDGSGRPSIFVTNYENEFNALYKSLMSHQRLSFTFNTPAAGLSVIGPDFVAFGTKFVDVDNDGWEDIVISNGHVVYFPPRGNLKQRPILFMNMQHNTKSGAVRRYAQGSGRGGSFFSESHRGRGLAVGDLDNDGRPDLVLVFQNEPVRIVRNIAAKDHHWIGIALQGAGGRDIVGARLTLEVGDRKLVRFVKGGGSYLSAHDMRVVFGLGDAKAAGKLTIDWPSGEPRTQTVDQLEPNRYTTVRQGKN